MQMPLPGDIIDNRYEIERVLGQGGMGSVYLARHQRLGKHFAIKVLLPKHSSDPEYKVRFEREAKVTSRLNHRNAVQVYDTGEWRGLLFIVMEYLSGHTLYSLIPEGTPGELQVVLELTEQIAEVMCAAHDLGLVHRDLKPENIMVEYDHHEQPRFVVVDFGLAFVQNDAELSRMTRDAGVVSGTPAYLSPEQATAENIGPPSDIYSLGCVLYEAVSGRPPFNDTNVMRLLSQHMFVQPDSPRKWAPEADIPPQLESLIMMMLAKEPARRPTAYQLLHIIRDIRRAPDSFGRGRSDDLLLSRDLRQVEAPTARLSPTMRQRAEREEPQATGAVHTVAFIGAEPDPEALAVFGANQLRCKPVASLEAMQGCMVAYAPGASAQMVEDLSAHIPTLTTTAAGDMDRIAALLRAGAVDVLPEPVETSFLISKLKRAIKKARRKRRS